MCVKIVFRTYRGLTKLHTLIMMCVQMKLLELMTQGGPCKWTATPLSFQIDLEANANVSPDQVSVGHGV
jgi:hypothetical protein